MFSNATDLKSSTCLFICPACNRILFSLIFFFFGGGESLSINIRTVGGEEASRAAGRQMVLESVSDAPQNTNTKWD